MASSKCWRCVPRSMPNQLTPSLARLTLVPSIATSTACFSTSSSRHVARGLKKSVPKTAAQKAAMPHKNKKREKTGKPPAPGERKSMRKRIVLSNTNALEIIGMRDLDEKVVDAMAGRGVTKKEDAEDRETVVEEEVKKSDGLEELRAAVLRASGLAVADLTTPGEPIRRSKKLMPIPAGREAVGKVLGLTPETVDCLRAVDAFKITQGWGLFRRPSLLIREDSVTLVEKIVKAQEEQSTLSLILDGKKTSGKSVLLLHAMATAFVKGWVVINIPEAQEVTEAMTDYAAIPGTEPTLWSQDKYIASMLTQISKANSKLLDAMAVTREHHLPVPLQENISLTRLCELGARDPEFSWPFFQALWAELTAEGRPPIMFCLDGLANIMRNSLYRAVDFSPIHAHDLAIVDHFLGYFSGEKKLPNGGAFLAATSRSHAQVIKSVELLLDQKKDRLLNVMIEAENRRREEENVLIEGRRNEQAAKKAENTTEADAENDEAAEDVEDEEEEPLNKLRALKPVTPRDPYERGYDPRAEKMLENVELMHVEGLNKLEARGLMEYWAQSGVLRQKIDEQTVVQKWAIAGNGNVGEMQRSALWMQINP